MRLIARNRASDKSDIDRLENKIAALEKNIAQAKAVNESRTLDKLEQSLLECGDETQHLGNEDKPLDEEELELLEECFDFSSELGSNTEQAESIVDPENGSRQLADSDADASYNVADTLYDAFS